MSGLDGFVANGIELAGDSLELTRLLDSMDIINSLHVAILRQPYLNLIMDGTKTVESRFNTKRAAPFGRVAVGDVVLVKEPGQPVHNYFVALGAVDIDLSVISISDVRAEYSEAICPQNETIFWRERASSRYCTMIGVGEKGELPSLQVTKKDQRAWVTFERKIDSDDEEPLTLFDTIKQ